MRRLPLAMLVAALGVPVAGVAPAAAEARAPSAVEVADALGPEEPRAAVIYDPAEHRVLWGLRERAQLPPASTLKIATALVVAEKLAPYDEVTISERAALTRADRVQWRSGARFSADQVMHGMMMASSNGAATALAEEVAGSLKGFRKLAARRLPKLGARATRLVHPSGLDATGQYSTARDLAVLTTRLLDDPWLAQIVKTKTYQLPWPDGGWATFANINRFLSRDPSAVGVKNGFTSAAGNTLVAASTREGRSHIVVVLGSDDPYAQAERLMDLAFDLAPPAPGATADLVSMDPAGDAVEAEVLGLTMQREESLSSASSSPEEVEPAAAVSPLEPLLSSGAQTKSRLILAAPIALWGTRFLQVQRKRARRRRRVRLVPVR